MCVYVSWWKTQGVGEKCVWAGKRSSYITVHFATAASQNGFITCKLSFIRKLFRKRKKNFFITFIFCHGSFLKQDQYFTRFWDIFERSQNPTLCNQHQGKYSVTMTTCPVPLFWFSLVGGESESRVGGILFWSLWVKKHTAAFARLIFRRLLAKIRV